MATQMFEFIGTQGRKLSGRIELPQATLRGWAVVAHCFTCGKDSLAAVRLARALARIGVGTLRFDFAGLGHSEGTFSEGGFAADVEDIIAAVTAMEKHGMPPSLLVGHSLGGTAALAATAMLPGIRAVATVGAPSDVGHVLRQFDPEGLARIERDGQAEILLAGRPFMITRALVEAARAQDMETVIADLRRPLLVLHAPRDEVVGIDNATRVFVAAKHPKSFLSLDTADHLLSKAEDADYAATMIAAWATRYMPTMEEDLPQEVAEGVSAEETGKGKFQLAMRSGPHRFLADEPEAVGGMGSGLSPYDLVSAGLAACTTMTMRMYAERKGAAGTGADRGQSQPPQGS